MWLLALMTGCLVNTDLYEARRAALTDDDGDGWTEDQGDCDDAAPAVHPSAAETCDGVDEDCDGTIDEEATDAPSWFVDEDGDGHGDPSSEIKACDAPAGAVASADDCDDTQPLAWSLAEEVAYDGVDNDCVDGDLSDVDGDGYDAAVAGGGDCDDADAEIHPGAAETWANGVTDNDCDGEREAVDETYGAEAIIGSFAGGQFGRRVAPLGDVDGDGVAELLVGAINEGPEAENGGAVYLVNGIDGTTAADFPRLFTRTAQAYLGTVAGGVDVDGDGWPDAVASATNTDDGVGTVWLVSGSAFAEVESSEIEEVAWVALRGEEAGAYFGGALAFLGDLDGDGAQELGAGAAYATGGGFTHGGEVGIWSTAELESGALDSALWRVVGTFEDQVLGNYLQAAGDLDDDGYDDFLVGGWGVLGVILPGGSVAPSAGDPLFELVAGEVGLRCDPRMLGDVDGDGERDLGCASEAGTAEIFTALLATPSRSTSNSTWTVDIGEGSFIFDLQDLGDLDGDGRSETLIPPQTHAELDTAVAAVLFGDQITFGGTVDFEDLPLQVRSVRPYGAYGYRAVVPGDTDGDGQPDIVLAGWSDDEGGTDAGGIVILPVPR